MDLASSEIRLVVLKGSKSDFELISVKPAKLLLADDESADEVRAFRDAVFAFLRENAVEHVAIKKRAKRGDYAGGAVSFKLEGVVQLYPGCPVTLLSPQSIASAKKRANLTIPAGIFQYQSVAFEAAFAQLP